MIRDRCVFIDVRVAPDLMTPGRLSVKLESELLESLYDLPVSKASESSHLQTYNKGVVERIIEHRNLRLG